MANGILAVEMTEAAVGAPWSDTEVQAIVADYFHMLLQELSGQKYSKTAHRRALLPKLRGRSDASVELKHQNISAVLAELRAPWILGYKPRRNYQTALFEVVVARLASDRQFDIAAASAVEQPAVVPHGADFSHLIVPAPSASVSSSPDPPAYSRRTEGVHRDYLGLEARNRSLGLAGEEFVVAYERHRLHEVGAKKLIDKVEHVSKTRGDGLGYDVLSYESNGRERLIEVKTTAFGREAPFYLTRTELALSKAEPELFRLFRLFEFRRHPRMFDLAGPVDQRCRLDAVTYMARFL